MIIPLELKVYLQLKVYCNFFAHNLFLNCFTAENRLVPRRRKLGSFPRPRLAPCKCWVSYILALIFWACFKTRWLNISQLKSDTSISCGARNALIRLLNQDEKITAFYLLQTRYRNRLRLPHIRILIILSFSLIQKRAQKLLFQLKYL